jgi:hypothetical protein
MLVKKLVNNFDHIFHTGNFYCLNSSLNIFGQLMLDLVWDDCYVNNATSENWKQKHCY